jgi:hypothetical protein
MPDPMKSEPIQPVIVDFSRYMKIYDPSASNPLEAKASYHQYLDSLAGQANYKKLSNEEIIMIARYREEANVVLNDMLKEIGSRDPAGSEARFRLTKDPDKWTPVKPFTTPPHKVGGDPDQVGRLSDDYMQSIYHSDAMKTFLGASNIASAPSGGRDRPSGDDLKLTASKIGVQGVEETSGGGDAILGAILGERGGIGGMAGGAIGMELGGPIGAIIGQSIGSSIGEALTPDQTNPDYYAQQKFQQSFSATATQGDTGLLATKLLGKISNTLSRIESEGLKMKEGIARGKGEKV